MSIVSIKEKFIRTSEWKLEKFQRQYTRTFIVAVSSADDGPIPVLEDFLLNQDALGDYYDLGSGQFDKRAILISLSANQPDPEHACQWIVTGTWSTEAPDPDKQKDKPDKIPPNWSGGGQIEDSSEIIDLDGLSVTNSAGSPFPAGVVIPKVVQTIQLALNVSKLKYPTVSDLCDHIAEVQGKCNQQLWYGFPAENISCESVEFSEEYESGVPYWKLTYRMAIAPEDGRRTIIKVLDCGFEEAVLDPDTGDVVLKRIRDSAGQPLSSPFPLDGNGAKGDLDNPQYIVFRIRDTVKFTKILP